MMIRHRIVPSDLLEDEPVLCFWLDREGYSRRWRKLGEYPLGWALIEVEVEL